MPKRSRDSTDGSTTPESSVTDAVDFTAPIGAALTSASARAALAALSADDQAAVLQVLASASTFDVAALAAACVPHAVVPAVVAARVVAPHLPQSALPAATTAQLAQLLPFLWQVAIFPGLRSTVVDVLLEVAFTTPCVKSLRQTFIPVTSGLLHRRILEVDMEVCSLESLKLRVCSGSLPDTEALRLQFLALAISPLRRRLRILGLWCVDSDMAISSVELRGVAASANASDRRTASVGESVCTYEEAMASPLAALFPALECLLLNNVTFCHDARVHARPPRMSLGAVPPRLRTIGFLQEGEKLPLPFTSGLEQITALWTDPPVVPQCTKVRTLVVMKPHDMTRDDLPDLEVIYSAPSTVRSLGLVPRFSSSFSDEGGHAAVDAVEEYLDDHPESSLRELVIPTEPELHAVVESSLQVRNSLHDDMTFFDWCDESVSVSSPAVP